MEKALRKFAKETAAIHLTNRAVFAGGVKPSLVGVGHTYLISRLAISKLPPLPFPRGFHSGCRLLRSDCVFVTGGRTEFNVVSFVESMHVARAKWQPAPPLLLARFNHACCSFADCLLLVFCGFSSQGSLDAVERLSLGSASWLPVALCTPLRKYYKFQASPVAHDRLLLFGCSVGKHRLVHIRVD